MSGSDSTRDGYWPSLESAVGYSLRRIDRRRRRHKSWISPIEVRHSNSAPYIASGIKQEVVDQVAEKSVLAP